MGWRGKIPFTDSDSILIKETSDESSVVLLLKTAFKKKKKVIFYSCVIKITWDPFTRNVI